MLKPLLKHALKLQPLPRLTLLAALGIGAALLAYQTLLDTDSSSDLLLTRSAPSDRIDLYIDQPRGAKFNAQGRLIETFEGTRLNHFQTSNHAEISAPRFHIYTKRGTLWDGTARTANLIGDNEIHLRNDVIIVDAAGSTRLTTEQLNYFSQQQKVDSNVAVLLKRTGDTTKAVGMRADLNTNRIELLSHVEGLHAPR